MSIQRVKPKRPRLRCYPKGLAKRKMENLKGTYGPGYEYTYRVERLRDTSAWRVLAFRNGRFVGYW